MMTKDDVDLREEMRHLHRAIIVQAVNVRRDIFEYGCLGEAWAEEVRRSRVRWRYLMSSAKEIRERFKVIS